MSKKTGMQTYQCFKQVRAMQIGEMQYSDLTEKFVLMSYGDANGKHSIVYVDEEWKEKHRPIVGGYYVQYADGYESYSPKEAFEGGYTIAEDLPERITLLDIEALVVDEFYDHPTSTLTRCVLILNNGYTVTGESACANPSIFDAKKGQKYAKDDALEKVWPLEGYLLKQKMWEAGGKK